MYGDGEGARLIIIVIMVMIIINYYHLGKVRENIGQGTGSTHHTEYHITYIIWSELY